MRRSLVAATLAVAILLLAVPAVAGASTKGHRSGPPRQALPAKAALMSPRAALRMIKPSFVPAPQALGAAETADITGTALRYDGTPLAAADMAWWIDSGDYPSGDGSTDANGKYSFTGIPLADGNGTVRVDATDGSLSMASWGLTWTTGGINAFDLQPGGVQIVAEPGGPWGRRTAGMYTDTYSIGAGDSGGWTGATFARLSALAPAFPGTFYGGDVCFYPDEGLEIAGDGATVVAGETIPGVITVKESQAQRVWTGAGNAALTGPWGSGKPGSTLKLWLQNYPAGWTNQLLGWSLDGRRSAFKVLGDPVATGESRYAISLEVPAEATPGCGYNIDVMHVNGGPLTLDTWFQVCTLEATRTTIGKGSAVRLSGIIPVQGHAGPTAGKSSKVACWVHPGKAAQPTRLETARLRAEGWKYVGTFATDGHGQYRTAPVRFSTTSTVVMRYPGDGWYYPAYTSPLTITVR